MPLPPNRSSRSNCTRSTRRPSGVSTHGPSASEPSATPRGQWALVWRRLKHDRVALGCGVFLVVLVFAVGPGAPLYERIVGHGPNDPFPYAVSVQLRPSGPLTVTWDA